MRIRFWVPLLLACCLLTLLSPTPGTAQTTIYWKADHIRDANGVEIAVAMPLPSDTTVPSAPSSLTHTSLSDSSVTLSWTGSTDNVAVVGYRIYRFNIPVGISTSTTFTDSTLQPGTDYVFKVAEFDAAGNQSDFSGTHSFSTSGVPAAPGSLNAYRASSGLAINLYWTDHSLSESGFKIERKAWSGGTYSQIDTVSANVGMYSDSSIVGGTVYYYRVRAYNANGNSGYSNDANACNCSSTITALSAMASSTSQVDLVWASQPGSIDHYSVQRRSSVSSSFAEITTTTNTNYSDTSVSSSTTYMYKVVAMDGSSHELSSSNVDIATTVLFTDDPIAAGTTVIQAQHLTELRTAVNAARTAAGLSSATWTDSTPSGIVVKAVHISELRTALNAALSAMSVSVLPTYTDPTLTTGTTTIKKAHLAELREALK